MAGDHNSGPGKNKGKFYVSSLAREGTEEAINLLLSTVRDANLKREVRVKAAEVLLDRGWGKAPQEIKLGGIDEDQGVKFIVEIVESGRSAEGSTGEIAGRSPEVPAEAACEVSKQPGTAPADQSVSGGNP